MDDYYSAADYTRSIVTFKSVLPPSPGDKFTQQSIDCYCISVAKCLELNGYFASRFVPPTKTLSVLSRVTILIRSLNGKNIAYIRFK